MKLPHKFGKYILYKKIAQGGMAEIYKAKYFGAGGFAKSVAIKRILPAWSNRKDVETMLIDEAKVLVHLRHQNIVQVLELGKDKEFFYISMEYIDGFDLRKIYNRAHKLREVIPVKFSCFIVSEILKGLEFAHRQLDDEGNCLDIVHRDISPQNILISTNGEVKLTDFGIAKGLHRSVETTHASLKGKYAYMSPEQADGKKVDHRSDIYSVGIVLFELLTSLRLFGSGNDFETLKKVRKSQMPFGWEGSVPLNMRQILMKALALDMADRYQTAGELLKDINDYIAQKKLYTHSLELADYLRVLFSGGCAESEFDDLPANTRVMDDELNFPRVRLALLVFLLVPFLAVSFGKTAVRNVRTDVSYNVRDVVFEKKSPISVKEVRPVGPVMPSFKASLDDLDLGKIQEEWFSKAQSPKTAKVSVQVRPWGYIYIPGIVSRRESPVHGVSLRPGIHSVKVYYSPLDRWATAKLNAEPGKNYFCFADFTRGSKISCR